MSLSSNPPNPRETVPFRMKVRTGIRHYVPLGHNNGPQVDVPDKSYCYTPFLSIIANLSGIRISFPPLGIGGSRRLSGEAGLVGDDDQLDAVPGV